MRHLSQVPKASERQKGIYYAGYFSFHGADEQAQVLFTINNNRELSKKGATANNFLYFNDDGEWQALKVHKKFKSKESNLERVPWNEDFEFSFQDDHPSKSSVQTKTFASTLRT